MPSRTSRKNGYCPIFYGNSAELFRILLLLVGFWGGIGEMVRATEPMSVDKRRIDRFWEIALQSPRRGATFDRLYGLYVDSGHANLLLEKCLAESRRSVSGVKDSKSFQLLGLLYERRGETDRAIEAFENATTRDPKNALAPFYLAEQLVAKNRIADALDALEESIRRKPARIDLRGVLQTLGRLSVRSGDRNRSELAWAQLDRLYPDDPDLSIQIAEILESEGRLDDALARYQRLLEKPSTDGYARVRFTLAAASIKIRQKKETEALADFSALLDRLAQESWLAESVRMRIERLFTDRADDRGLVDFYWKRLRKRPDETETTRRLAAVLIRLHRENEARKLLETGIEKHPTDIPLRLSLIDLLVRRREIVPALEQYREIDRLLPNNADYLTEWGRLALTRPDRGEAERKSDAVEIWTRMCPADSDDPVACLRVADLAVQYEIPETAERFYRKAVDLRPKNSSYREYLGLFYHRNYRKEKAVKTLRSIPEIADRSVESLVRTGTIFQSIGYVKESYEMFREAAEKAPDDLSVQWKFLETLIRRDDFKAVSRQLASMERLVERDEDFALFLQREVRVLREAKKFEAATRTLAERIAENLDGNTRSLWRLAVYYQAEGKIVQAVDMLRRALQAGRAPIPLLRFVVDLYEEAGEDDKALALCRTLAETDGVWRIEHLKRLATLQLKYGRIDQALETGRKFMELGSGNAANGRFYAELLLRAERQAEGIEAVRQALRAGPGDPLTLKLLAKNLAETDRTGEAIEIAWRLFDRTENILEKLDAVSKLADYYEKSNDFEGLLDRFRQRGQNTERRRESELCLARALRLGDRWDEARATLEALSTSLGEQAETDTVLLAELVSVSEKRRDYAAAVRYQEAICRRSTDPVEADRLFVLYDLNGDREKAVALFLKHILLKTDPADRLRAIDRMIRREEYAAVDKVLAFLEIHEAADWRLAWRRLALASYLGEEGIAGLSWDFRDLSFPDENPTDPVPIEKGWKLEEIRERFRSDPWRLPGSLPTEDWTETGIAIPVELLSVVRRQELYLPTVFRDRLERNKQYRTPNDVPPPKPFDEVRTFREARFLALAWMLKEAVGRNDLEATVRELREEIPADDPERVRLECLLHSLTKIQE